MLLMFTHINNSIMISTSDLPSFFFMCFLLIARKQAGKAVAAASVARRKVLTSTSL